MLTAVGTLATFRSTLYTGFYTRRHLQEATRNLLHQRVLPPNCFYTSRLLRRNVMTSRTFHTISSTRTPKELLHQKGFYTRTLLHQRTFSVPENRCTRDRLYNEPRLLYPRHFEPKTKPFTAETLKPICFASDILFAKELHTESFAPEARSLLDHQLLHLSDNFYTKEFYTISFLHQKPIYTGSFRKLLHQAILTPEGLYTRNPSRRRTFTPNPLKPGALCTKELLHQKALHQTTFATEPVCTR